MPEHRPVVVIVAGPNGSGKTTLTTSLVSHHWLDNCLYINPDDIALHEFGNWNTPGAVLKAAQRADALRETAIKQRKSVAYETVFSTPGRVEFIARARQAGYFARLFFVGTDDPAINIRRVAQRVREGGHDVPKAKIIARHGRSLRNLERAIRIVDRAYLYDNSVDDREPQLILRSVEGRLRKLYVSRPPDWAAPAIAQLKAD